ncbi:AAA family ATPase [Nocardia yunnanensis]|uniref:AAA family ATPase n=1 Tax=Nocardia yunnanensis TaxID=2382165 RepID=A0A386ZJ28_9NOCA|nr:AAA family ATPase [Nocardia yunnanensis]AYF77253.1 AAA family ATPase [Nocardia yunnanensis]
MPEIKLTARRNTSGGDARWGLVRLHPEVLMALGLRPGDGVTLTGGRRTTAVVGQFKPTQGHGSGVALLDEVTLANAKVRDGGDVTVAPATVSDARMVAVTGSDLAMSYISESTIRQALLGKIVTVGDSVTLLPRDLLPGDNPAAARLALKGIGIAWTSEVLKVTVTDPRSGPVTIRPSTAVVLGTATDATDTPMDLLDDATRPNPVVTPAPSVHAAPLRSAVAVADLAGVQSQAAKLTEWLQLSLDEPKLLKALGASPHLGALITGPAGVGKATLARAVAGQRRLVVLDGPAIGSLESGSRLLEVSNRVTEICSGAGGILLITDIDALLPDTPEPVATLILDQLRCAVARPAVAVLATTSNAVGIDRRLRSPELFDREVSLPLPTAAVRTALLERLLRDIPADGLKLDEIAARTPGFVVSDLAALLREAALRAAGRASREESDPLLRQEDLIGALDVIRPLSRSGSEELAIGHSSLDDVGGMDETKQALTEAVLWPLQHPDSFARLGIEPPRGVLLYGPPGCGKTFLVRALAGSGQLSVHSVKGAELLDKWVGSSERAVRELFQRARDSAPSLIFLDEIDALAPRRGQANDAGVTDRVVAALLTELDGAEPLRDVVVIGATNRPELIDPAVLRPGRLEKLVFVPPPDAAARADILRTLVRKTRATVPALTPDAKLRKVAKELEGYSAADCTALLREAALAAMRRDIDAGEITSADLTAARAAVRPSLDPIQVESLRRYAEQRAASGPAGDSPGYV